LRAFSEVLKSKEYIIEFPKVRMGSNEYSFNLNDDFLSKIEGSAIQRANVIATLALTKAEHLYELQFHLEGTVTCECDVCLEQFELPVDTDYQLLMKVSEVERYDDDEIIYITDKLIEYDLTQYLYESLMLSIPVRKTCNMSGTKECNKEVIAKLEELRVDENTEDEDESNPTWDKLKDIFNN
jgi:uncharacterized metal-binding protein YceD (DUF177 family)